MEDWQIRNINTKMQNLILNVTSDTLLMAELRENNLLSESEEATLENLKRRAPKEEIITTLFGFLKAKSNSYQLLIRCLENCGQTGAVNILDSFPKQLDIFFGERNPQFYGRKKELENLYNFTSRGNYSKTQNSRLHRLTVVTGMGGVGKTELCKKCVSTWLERDRLLNAVLINGESEASFEISLKNLAIEFGIATRSGGVDKDIKSIMKEVLEYLKHYKMLFVFDNVDKVENFTDKTGLLYQFFDMSTTMSNNKHKPMYLITSRFCNWDSQLGVQVSFYLENMEFHEAYGWVSTYLEAEKDSYKALVDRLDRYTLAIQQSISLIKQRNEMEYYSIQRFLEDLSAVESKLVLFNNRYLKSFTNSYEQTTFTTFLTSIEYLLTQENGTLAFQYLAVCAYLNPDNIEPFLFLQNNIQEAEKSRIAFDLLKACSLLSLTKDKCFKIHRILQEVLQMYFIQKKDELSKLISCSNVEHQKIIQFFSTEQNILENCLELLKLRNAYTTSHGTHVWKYAGLYAEILKKYYAISKYGLLQLSPLHLLVDDNDVKAVNQILNTLTKTYPSSEVRKLVNMTDRCTRTPAFIAAAKGYRDILIRLKAVDADFGIPSSLCFNYFEKLEFISYQNSHFTALQIAAYNNQIDTVETILGFNSLNDKVVLTTRWKIEKSSYVAAMVGNLDLVEKIWPTDIVAQAAAIARKYRHDDNQIIIDRFEKLFRKTGPFVLNTILETIICGWQNLFSFIISQNVSEVVLDWFLRNGLMLKSLCIPRCPTYICSCNNGRLLIMAATGNNVAAFKWLVRKYLEAECKSNGCEPNPCKGKCCIGIDWHFTPLYEGAKHGSVDVAKFILENNGENGIRGLDIRIDIQDRKGDTPLYQAAYWGHQKMVEFLVERGADINRKNVWGSTPIIAASLQAKFETVIYLAKRDNILFQPAQIDKSRITLLGIVNMTALHATVAHDSVEMTGQLIKILEAKDHLFLESLLKDAPTSVSLLHTAVAFDSPKIIRFLKEKFGQSLWTNSELNLLTLLRGFLRLAENRVYNISLQVVYRVKFVLWLIGILLGNRLSVTPYQMAMLLENHKCAEMFSVNDRNDVGGLSGLLLKRIISPSIKVHLSHMKQYLGMHGGSKEPVGGDVVQLVTNNFNIE